jgi:hypothetical protein
MMAQVASAVNLRVSVTLLQANFLSVLSGNGEPTNTRASFLRARAIVFRVPQADGETQSNLKKRRLTRRRRGVLRDLLAVDLGYNATRISASPRTRSRLASALPESDLREDLLLTGTTTFVIAFAACARVLRRRLSGISLTAAAKRGRVRGRLRHVVHDQDDIPIQ